MAPISWFRSGDESSLAGEGRSSDGGALTRSRAVAESPRPLSERQGGTARTARTPAAAAKVTPLPLREELGKRWRTTWQNALAIVTAFALATGFFLFTQSYWAPVHSGVDQNGYLVGGKMIARQGTMKFAPSHPVTGEFDPHQFVGRMWVGADLGADTERYYPKYPLGLPLLYGGALLIGGPAAAFLISPICMALAIAGTFLLIRLFTGTFLAILGTLVMASSQVTLQLANNPNSHASTICFVVWGMYLLIRWWQVGGVARAGAAGLLLGFAVTIRYTEGLLLLPLVLVMLFRLQPQIGKGVRMLFRNRPDGSPLVTAERGIAGPRRTRSILTPLIEPAALLGGWMLPVLVLVSYNLATIGSLTGYDPTNESTGFRLEFARDNWETMIRHLHVQGLYLMFPLALAGMVAMYWWSWRLALVMTTWIVPCLAIYVFYYWAPDGDHIRYLRFVSAALPGMVLCGVWVLGRLSVSNASMGDSAEAAPAPAGWRPATTGGAAVAITAGALVALAAGLQLHAALPGLESDHRNRVALHADTRIMLDAMPPGSVVFSSQQGLIHQLQFEGDYVLYRGDTFNTRSLRRWLPDGGLDPDDPQGLDPARRAALEQRLGEMDQRELYRAQRTLVHDVIESGQRVFVVERGANPDRTPELVRRATVRSQGLAPARSEVVRSWRTVVPATQPDTEDEPQRRPGRIARSRWSPPGHAQSETAWTIYEITLR